MTDNKTTDLVRLQLENSLQSPFQQLARDAEVVMLLIDTSGSMDAFVGKAGKSRIDALREVVKGIKAAGDVPMIAFGGPYDAEVRFVDTVPAPDGGTPLHAAIPFAKQYGATRLVVISDGVPDLREQSMNEAIAFGGKIDVVFIGDPGEVGSFFLDQLAKATGGTRLEGDLSAPKQLTSAVIAFLEGEVDEHAPIQGEGFTTIEPEDVPEPDDDDDDDEDEEEEDDDDDA